MKTAISSSLGRAAGFTIVGEPLALDLINTIKTAVVPARELMADEQASEAFWALEAPVLPEGSGRPGLEATRVLRATIHRAVRAAMAGHAVDEADAHRLNDAAALATVAPRLLPAPDGGRIVEAWQATTPHDLALAAAARSAIDLIGGPLAPRLRECAAPRCSMVFVATNSKRQWCVASGCGNRQRAARHAAAAKTGR